MKTKHDRIQFYCNKMIKYFSSPESKRSPLRHERIIRYEKALNNRLIADEKVRYHMF